VRISPNRHSSAVLATCRRIPHVLSAFCHMPSPSLPTRPNLAGYMCAQTVVRHADSILKADPLADVKYLVLDLPCAFFRCVSM
jgi:hypothetical protein